MDEIPFDGHLKLGHNVELGYYAQNQAQLLDENKTVFQTIDDVAKGDIRLKIRDILGAFMFGGEASDKKVKVLSGGERSRLAMIRLLLEPVNLLILDEPTNHLDMRTKDVLKEAILAFDGTVILVSHDRDFLDGLVSKVYEFGGGNVREHIGGIYDFLRTKDIDTLDQLPKRAVVEDVVTKEEPNAGKLSYEQQKEQAKLRRKAEKEVADWERKVEEIEQRISEMEQQMSTPEGASDISLATQYAEVKKQQATAEEEWEAAVDRLSALDEE